MKRFRELTKEHVVIMGRKTFESIGRPLPKRINIIVTRDNRYTISARSSKDGIVYICQSLDRAINLAKEKEKKGEIFVIGGGQIYEQAMKYADKLYLTIVAPLRPDFTSGLRWGQADTFFPDYSEFKKVVYRKESNDENYKYTFLFL